MMRIRWEKPIQGWWKLNTDGSYCGNTGLAGCGGVVRDDEVGGLLVLVGVLA